MTNSLEYLPSPEPQKDGGFEAVRAAAEDYERLLREADEILRTTPDRIAGERLIVAEYADRIEQAARASEAAFRAWFEKILRDAA